jgi:hypothetical protein
MTSIWYELRVAGSAGTHAGTGSGIREGIAIAENGRLCALSSGHAKRFNSQQEAVEFLGCTSVPGIYDFEPVRCESEREAA